MKKILFLDLDGTIRQTKSGQTFIDDPADQEPMPGAKEAIAHYYQREWTIIGITNQGGVAADRKSLNSAIKEQQITCEIFPEITAIFFCPDFEGKQCYRVETGATFSYSEKSIFYPGNYRKPGDGMLRLASYIFNFDLNKDCWMVGDRPEDQGCAENAGVSFCIAKDWRSRFTPGVTVVFEATIELVRFLED